MSDVAKGPWMFEGWSEFYVMSGSAAAVLIGLIFVVISLMQDRPRSSVLAGSKLYMGPIVLGVSFVLLLSAAALAPGIRPHQFAAIAGGVAVWGFVRGVNSIVGLRRLLGGEREVHWTDMWFYGVIPSAIYLALGAVAVALSQGRPWAPDGVAMIVTAILLSAVRNEWDLITWIAPRPDENTSDANPSED